jgi:hypothetical protein
MIGLPGKYTPNARMDTRHKKAHYQKNRKETGLKHGTGKPVPVPQSV